MRVLCTICTELFDGTRDVSAVPCGHTFHADCLSRWLDTSLTCPQCRTRVTRKAVISRLFFSQPDKLDDTVDEPVETCQLVNELETAKVNLRQKETEISQMLAEKLSAEENLKQSNQNFKELEKLHKEDIAKCKLLKQELINYKDMQYQTSVAKQEASELKKQLASLLSVQRVINGCEDEIKEMVTQNSDVGQLATWCCIYKRELDRKKTESRECQDSNRKLKRDLESAKSLLSERTTELTSCKEHTKFLEEDISSQDQQISSLKKKIEALQAAIASPSNTTSSFARRLINESPAPCFSPSEHPRLARASTFDPNQSLDLFDTPVKEPGSSSSDLNSKKDLAGVKKRKLLNEESKSKLIKISSASDIKSKEMSDISNVPDIMQLNIMKKKQQGFLSNMSEIFRQGYNGLGGHEKFVKPPPRQLHMAPLKRTKSGKYPRSNSNSAVDQMPPLPTLIELD